MPTPTLPAWEFSFPAPDSNEAYNDLLADTGRMAEISAAWGEETIPHVSQHFVAAKAQVAAGADVEAEADAMTDQMNNEFTELVEAKGGHLEQGLNLTPGDFDQLQAMFNQRDLAQSAYYNRNAPGAALDSAGVWANAGEMLRGVFAAEKPRESMGWEGVKELRSKAKIAESITMAYSSHIGEDGGFLVPEQFRAQLLQIALEEGVMRGRSTVIPMSTGKVTIPAIHETSRTTSLFGGIIMYWTPEEAAAQTSEAAFKTVSLEPNTLSGAAQMPLDLIADTMASDAYFGATFPAAMAYETDDTFIQGNGVGRPLGWLKAGCLIEVAKESAQAADTVEVENVANMYARLPGNSMGRAVWIINQTVIPQLLTMSDASGNQPIWAMNIANGAPATILGRPVIVTEKVNALGGKGDINLIDPSYYLIGDRQSMTVTTSDDYKFLERLRTFLITERVDGRPWLREAITPRRGGDTLSPFVTLAERA